MEVVYAELCPFAHRTWLAAEEGGKPYVKHVVTSADLGASADARPQWWKDLYAAARGRDAASSGKVPILVDSDVKDSEGKPFVVTESAVTTDYAIMKAAPHLISTDPVDRARTALFLEQKVGAFIKAWYGLLSAQGEEAVAAQKEAMRAALAGIEEAYGDKAKKAGPYFLGSELSFADIMVWPWLGRFGVITHYRGYSIPEEFKAVHAFVAAMHERPAVKATQKDDAFYIEGYVKYANGTK